MNEYAIFEMGVINTTLDVLVACHYDQLIKVMLFIVLILKT